MGGITSGRWNTHIKKVLVEACWPLEIRNIKSSIRSGVGHSGAIRWFADNKPEGSIGYQVVLSKIGLAIRLVYVLDDRRVIDYVVGLQTTGTAWGAPRWWFTCPSCDRRAGKLYLPPFANYFACWRCHNLAWKSNQQQHTRDLEMEVLVSKTGCTAKEAKRFLRQWRKKQRI